MSARASNLYLRAGVVLVMALFIGAPTPGYVSGCSTATGSVNPQEYCRGYNERVCARDKAAGRLDDSGYAGCIGNIELMCSGVSFPIGCSPSVSAVQACFDALTDPTRVGTDELMLPECGLCGGSALSEGI